MSWGVATQNGVSVSLASIVSLSAGVTEFSPIDLFTGGTVGAWYDPSDYSTLFQDSAGTTPVTAVEQPVGLMLDKSQGLVLGSELITPVANQDFSSDTGFWQKDPGITISSGSANWVNIVNNGYSLFKLSFLTAGKYYEITYTITSISGGTLALYLGGTLGQGRTTPGTYTERLTMSTVNNVFSVRATSVTLLNASIDNISVREIPGNHASQSTSTSRPVLRARYNNLTYSEQFDNAAWTTTSATVSANTTATTDPLGGNTADSLIASAANSQHRIYQAFSSSDYTLSVYAKAGTASFISLSRSSATAYATFNLSTGVVSASAGGTATIQNAGNGWWRCTLASTVATSYLQIAIGTTAANAEPNAAWLGAGENVYVWGAQAVTGSSAGTYQRIAAATDYATAGFLPYLYFITDDSFGTNSINFSATDKMSVCAGVTKLNDAAAALITELSTNYNTNNGSFFLAAPSAAAPTNDIAFTSRGSAAANINQQASTVVAAPTTKVISALNDIAASTTVLRSNGADVNTATGSKGTGNFGNYPLFIGRRNNATLPFEGRIYGLIVAGKTLSASELSATEAWMNSKTGAY